MRAVVYAFFAVITWCGTGCHHNLSWNDCASGGCSAGCADCASMDCAARGHGFHRQKFPPAHGHGHGPGHQHAGPGKRLKQDRFADAHHEMMYPPGSPPSPTVAYPYYTTRAPRDFLMANPPSIGP